MHGLMQHHPLRIIDILTYAAEAFPDEGIVSVREEGDVHRITYPDVLNRVSQLAHALQRLGVGIGDRVATLAWNGFRHFELYYGVSGIGAVCHTINPRLSQEQLCFIIAHAEDKVICVDPSLLPVLEAAKAKLPQDIVFIVLTDPVHMPDTSLDVLSYEELLAAEPPTFDWPVFPEETAAGLCYTSGTTGNPKGALYSHRSTVLHALMVVAGHPQSLANGKSVLPVVPLFHVNAWGMPYTAPLVGMTMVMPGSKLDGASLFRLMDAEQVFSAWGVPTVWAGLLQEIQTQGRLPKGFVDLVVGGSAAPRSMIAAYEEMGVNVNQAWGMTEMSPIGTRGILPRGLQDAPFDEQVDAKVGAGRRLFGVDFKIVDEDGMPLPHDGQTAGELFVRGNTIISGYFENEDATQAAMDSDGWFGTGDVSTLDANGRLIVRDRAKDLVKSGGEWISSIDLENAAVSHPGIAACAVIAIPHAKWDERPVLVVVPEGKAQVSLEEIHAHLTPEFARWQLPDDILFVEALPLTATGKVSKLTLRAQFADYVLPDERDA
ncbi:long-chain fatty acid--CoA ligase [Roseovarius rhodophyticola]|uniref:Long-chain fatty acid--CoA ligase n=1 Tax=Roseovarius rhodophyticola TaxID=3080827 RepID=A0ABZ2THL3_9RHOB|nr:long-chain fatty acid--CoA ligase [Roseovarius sp. W115]MDV2929469.1 long-chain fatty acid--CoA ligase [Roseovarius sp. W115]